MLVIQACSVIIYIFEGYIIQKIKKKKKNKKINEKFFFGVTNILFLIIGYI